METLDVYIPISLNDITIYIPTINRPIYLDRCLHFLSLYNEKINIFIFDSSEIENKNKNLDVIKTFKEKFNIKYIYEFDIDEKFDNMGQICYYVMKNHIMTKYVTFCGDDDFLFIHNLYRHIKFLENNKDYIICHGNIIMFKEQEKEFIYNGCSCSMDLSQENPLERFLWYCFNGATIQYGVIRTKDFERVHRFCHDIKQGWLSSEVLPTILSTLYGKIKNLKVISAMQEWGHSSISIKSDNEKYNNWLFRITNFDKNWADSFTKMSNIFYSEIKNVLDIDDNLIYKYFENGISFRIIHTLELSMREFMKDVKNSRDLYLQQHKELAEIGKTKLSNEDIYYTKMVLNS